LPAIRRNPYALAQPNPAADTIAPVSPGASDPIHRHDAHAFVYVLEGSIVMQVRDAAEVTLSPGQTYYEGPNDVHIVGRKCE
jgi:quercetin dioxygenase-like cupin family protein